MAEISEETLKKAEEFKLTANDHFGKQKYALAIDFYSKAIELNSKNAVYLSNRAFAYAKLEQYGAALQDASAAIDVDPKYIKAYYRRGSANLLLGKYKEALKDFKKVVGILPKNAEAQEKFKQCEKIVRQMAFESAIATEDEKPLSETLDVESISVESSYDGPHLMDGKVDLSFVQQLVAHLKAQKKLHTKYLYQILIEMKKLLCKLPSLIDIEVPEGNSFSVCGDTHGQYYDLLNIFEINGQPSIENPYLCESQMSTRKLIPPVNGDYVDRGSFSLELVLTLFAYKLLYPDHVHLMRGNHETINMNRMYGFEGEVTQKYSKKCFDLFTEVFNWLPLSACLNKKVIIVHGGLFSKDGVKLDDMRKISRNRQPPDEGLMCELLWSDPSPFPGRSPNKRGVGVAFGPDVTHKFLKDNNLQMVVRSHEVKEEGYLVEADGKLVTVFSAPNYCDSVGNKGALIRFDSQMNPKYVQFTAVPHPAIKPMAYASNYNMFMK
ncbi:serine/threonine-protein phosphatase 5 [Planoprotostelium fungivorum]|uniref:Serine/threonine-protein phosphatase n=1 Tax=Planoprotostelium fungivorum TaxID=1890364 RepID=A0A2P6MNB6_9EUKA|nr:serine/threonine-protein phosphatase 5 [Planoprotostelium fungivorum]